MPRYEQITPNVFIRHKTHDGQNSVKVYKGYAGEWRLALCDFDTYAQASVTSAYMGKLDDVLALGDEIFENPPAYAPHYDYRFESGVRKWQFLDPQDFPSYLRLTAPKLKMDTVSIICVTPRVIIDGRTYRGDLDSKDVMFGVELISGTSSTSYDGITWHCIVDPDFTTYYASANGRDLMMNKFIVHRDKMCSVQLSTRDRDKIARYIVRDFEEKV